MGAMPRQRRGWSDSTVAGAVAVSAAVADADADVLAGADGLAVCFAVLSAGADVDVDGVAEGAHAAAFDILVETSEAAS